MSIGHKIIPHYTYEDWVRWEGSWELIEGHPIAMSPAPTPRHQKVSAKIISQLTKALEKSQCHDCAVYNFIDYKIEEDTIVQPDVLIVCGEIEKKYLDFSPTLVVEILSPATALKDRHTKYELYQQQKVKYYLIIDLDTEIIQVFEMHDENYVPVSQTNYYSFKLADNCIITPNLSNIFN
jgi:Uma2 family endonuclease